ncbi:MAG: hypothetical protein ACI9DC_001726 [Gammaproteobacteria bacterium]|jgi:hypothetical protein
MECKDTTDELYVLGFIAGLCNQEPRDKLLLGDMLMYLREVQEVRQMKRLLLVAVPLALTFALTVSPVAISQDIGACTELRPIVDTINKDAGAMVDGWTQNLGAALLCNSKVIDFKKKLITPFSMLNPGWQGRKQKQWDQIYCNDKEWRALISAGWTVAHTLVSSVGERFYMKAECP